MSRPQPSLALLAEALARHQAADAQTRRKLGRGLGHDAMQLASIEGLSPREIDLLLTALQAGARAHSYPQKYLRAQAELMARRRTLTGQPDPEVAWQKAKTIDVEMGGLDLYDPEARPAGFDLPIGSQAFMAAMNEGEFFTIGLPGDGMLKVRLRVIGSGPIEPLAREFRRMRGATPAARLRCKSGRLLLHGGGRAEIAAEAPGEYVDVRAFHLGAGRSQEVLVLAGPAGRDQPPPLTGVPDLEVY